MKKFLKLIMVCALISSAFTSAANAASAADLGEDAECLSVEAKGGVIYSVCIEGEVKSSKIGNRTKSEILELAHQLKRAKAKANQEAAAKTSNRRDNYYYEGSYDSGSSDSLYPGGNYDSGSSDSLYPDGNYDSGASSQPNYPDLDDTYGSGGDPNNTPDGGGTAGTGGGGGNPFS